MKKIIMINKVNSIIGDTTDTGGMFDWMLFDNSKRS